MYKKGDYFLIVSRYKDIDLSNSTIEGISISLEDIKGAIIDSYQLNDLAFLLGVKTR